MRVIAPIKLRLANQLDFLLQYHTLIVGLKFHPLPTLKEEPSWTRPMMIGEVPAYPFDKHTAAGKAAIHRLARECPAVRNALAAHVPEYRANEAASMAAFYADAEPVAIVSIGVARPSLRRKTTSWRPA
jgi:hypothetical protein